MARKQGVAPADTPRILVSGCPMAVPNWKVPAMATGYGRDMMEIGRGVPTVTEIKAHARGAHHLFSNAEAVIDIGGQDLKVIRLDAKGRVRRFEMNDRCAAGTGRFLEVMAERLGYATAQMGQAALRGSPRVRINSTCTVFAESEVIGLLSRGACREDIARALHVSVVTKIVSMWKRVSDGASRTVLTGGGAMNPGLVQPLRAALGCEVLVPAQPQIVGAVGAALLAD